MNRGFLLSLEALLSLLFLVLVILAGAEEKNEWNELAVLQKQHDLILVWDKTNTTTPAEMKRDFEMVFPHNGGKIIVGKKEVVIGTAQKNRGVIHSSIYAHGKNIPITLTVYY